MSQYMDSQQFARFMVTTLFHQMSAWVDTLNKGHLKQEFVYRLGNAISHNRLLVKEIEKSDELTETLFRAGEQFEKVIKLFMRCNQENTAGTLNLLHTLEILAGDDLDEVEQLWKDMGVYIGQQRARLISGNADQKAA